MLPFGIFATLFQTVLTSGLTVTEVERIIEAGVTAVEFVAQGRYPDALNAITGELPEVLPTLEKAAQATFPNLPIAQGVALITDLISSQHKIGAATASSAIANAQA
jgi:hypothetical protein